MLKRFLISAIALMLAVSVSVLPAQAQTTQPAGQAAGPIETPSADQPKAGDILQHIPADCMAFYVAPNMGELLKATETYAKDIGLGEELGGIAPKGLLETVARSLQVSKGYNPNGGVALVILDFEKAGIDIKNMMQGAGPAEPPFVILLAGDSAESVFPTKTIKNEDGTTSVTLIDSPSAVEKLGDYLAISPYPNGLELFKSEKSILDVLEPEKAKILQESLVAEYIRMEAVVQFMDGVADMMEAQRQMMIEQGWEPGEDMLIGMSMIKSMGEMASQMKDVTAGMKMVEGGMVADVIADYKPDSAAGLQLAATKPGSGKLLSRLPNLPYVTAMGVMAPGEANPEAITQSVQMCEALLGMLQLEMPENLKADMIKLSKDMAEQIQSIQVVGGGAKADGVFGTAMVLQVKNAQKTRELLADESELLTNLVAKTLAMKEENLDGLVFKYTQGAETVGAMTVDTIEVTHPEMAEMEEWQKNEMAMVMGDSRIVFRVAPVDLTTVVISFGGGDTVLSQAVEAAQKGGPLESDPGIATALKHVPGDLGVMVFSPQNLMNTVIAEATDMGEEVPDVFTRFKWTDTTPVAIGMSAKGTQARAAVFVPTSVVKDSVQLGKDFEEFQRQQYEQMRREMGGAEATPPADNNPPANDF